MRLERILPRDGSSKYSIEVLARRHGRAHPWWDDALCERYNDVAHYKFDCVEWQSNPSLGAVYIESLQLSLRPRRTPTSLFDVLSRLSWV